MVVTVFLCGARAAILAVAISTIILAVHLIKKRVKVNFTFLHYMAMGGACILLFTGMYFMKKDSADGRLLIWHCSGQLVKEAPLLGHGDNGFTARYMMKQASYFSQYPESKYAMLADNIHHPFNEFIKEMVEYGIIGFLLILLLLLYPYCYSRKDKSMQLFVIRISTLSIGVCALFSYPLDYPFPLLIVVMLVAFVSTSMKKTNISASNGTIVKSLLIVCSVILFALTGYEIYYEHKWKSVAYSSLAGQTEIMLPEYDYLYKNTYLGNKGLFLYNYGAELNYIGRYNESNRVLLMCSKYLNDYDVQMLLGYNYEKLDSFNYAEKHHILAHKMVLVKFMPLYSLTKLYDKTGQTEKARTLAEEIINKEVKIPSLRITRIKKEMQQLISKMAEEKGLPPDAGDVKVKSGMK